MKIVVSILFFAASIAAIGNAQTKSKDLNLLNPSGNIITLSTPAAVTNNSIVFPGTLGSQGALMYISSVAGSVGTTTWLNPTTNGFVLTLSGGIPSWSNPATVNWQLAGNAPAAAYNGTTGSFVGTTNTQPLVLATTNTGTAQPIEFFANNVEKMRLAATGEFGIGLTPTAGKLLHVSGTAGTSNVRLASLASATGTTGRVMFATDATGDLQTLAFPGSNAQVLTSTTAGVLSWTTPTTGTVTSVGLAMPGIFTVSNSPVLSSGTLTATLNTQTANFIFAGPATGAAAAPTFRLMAAADMPVFVASGASHAAGAVPDPGASAGTTRFLREDATWAVPSTSTQWLLGGNSSPSSNIFGTTSATNVLLEANSTQTIQLTGIATANYDVGSALFGTTATPIVSTGDKVVINGGNFSLNSETNGAITREIVFRGTAGSGNLRIRGDGNDLYWQGGGGKNLQMGAYWQINLLGQLQTAAIQALSTGTTFAHVYIPLQQSGDPGLVIQNASGQTSDPFQIQAYNATQGSGTILTRVTSAGYLGIGSTTPTSPLHISQAVTASGGNATGAFASQTLTAAANNDVLYGVNITPTFTNGAFTGLTNCSFRSVYAGTLLNGVGVHGEASGNGGANTEVIGVWGISSNTTQASNTNAGTGVRAEGNGTTTDANSNIALHVINGEFVVGRQASSAANDNTAGNNILVANEDDNSGLSDQGPSGIVDITDGGNPAVGTPTTGTLQVFNRYAKAHSIILITAMTGGAGVPGPNEATTYKISGRTNGSFSVDVRRSIGAGAAGTAGTWRVAFLIVNPGK